MTPMKMTSKATGKSFHAVVDREKRTIYTNFGIMNFPNDERFNTFMELNPAEETPLEPKNFSFFRI